MATATTSVRKSRPKSSVSGILSKAKYDRLPKAAKRRFDREGELSEEFEEYASQVCDDVEAIFDEHGLVGDIGRPSDRHGSCWKEGEPWGRLLFRKTDPELHSVELSSLDPEISRGEYRLCHTFIDIRKDAYAAIASVIQERAELLLKVAAEIRSLSGKAVTP